MINLSRFKKRKKSTAKLYRPLLVLLSDGFSLLATVVDKKEEEVTIVASARSAIIDPVTALAEVLGKLSVSYGKIPKETILIHTHTIPSMLDLAINNIDQIEEDKLQELIRWEMEANYADLLPRESMGWLLVGLGYISEEQRDLLIKKQIEASSNGNKIRLGEFAIENGYINRNQLENCLKVQDQLQLQDQRIKSGWTRLDVDGEVRWLASAVSMSVHAQWVSALKEVSSKGAVGKTQLKSIYPYISSGSSQLNNTYTTDTTFILELHRPYLALNKYTNGSLNECLVLPCSSDVPILNDVESLIHNADVPEGSDIYVMVTHADRVSLREDLSSNPRFYFKTMEQEVILPTNISGDVSSAEAIMILGATFNYLTKSFQMMVPVEGIAPPPPVYKRVETKVAAVILIFSLVIASIEVTMSHKINEIASKLDTVEEKIERQKEVKKDLRKSQELESKISSVEQQIRDLASIKELMKTVLVTRNEFMDELLDLVVLNVNDNLLIDSIIERQWNDFEIRGWGLDQASVLYFNQGLSRDLQKWGLEITENPSQLQRNETGFSGYSFSIIIKESATGFGKISQLGTTR